MPKHIHSGSGPLKRFAYLAGEEPLENSSNIEEKEKHCKSQGHIQTITILNFARTYREIKCDTCGYSYYVDSSD